MQVKKWNKISEIFIIKNHGYSFVSFLWYSVCTQRFSSRLFKLFKHKLYHHDFFYPLRLKSHRFKILWLKVEIFWHPHPSCCMYVSYNFVFSSIQIGKVGSNKMYIWDILRLPRHAEGHLLNYKVDSVCSRLVNDVRWSIIYVYWLGKIFANFFTLSLF